MAPPVAPGEPRPAPKPQPLGNLPFIIMLTTCTCCALFLLWRRASSLRTVVAHQLVTWTRKEGHIRLSIDDGPPAHEFLEDDYDEDHERIADRELQVVASRQLDILPDIPAHSLQLSSPIDEPSTADPPLHSSELP